MNLSIYLSTYEWTVSTKFLVVARCICISILRVSSGSYYSLVILFMHTCSYYFSKDKENSSCQFHFKDLRSFKDLRRSKNDYFLCFFLLFLLLGLDPVKQTFCHRPQSALPIPRPLLMGEKNNITHF